MEKKVIFYANILIIGFGTHVILQIFIWKPIWFQLELLHGHPTYKFLEVFKDLFILTIL